MPVSDLAIYSRAQAVGFLASSFFVGGNIYVSGAFIPYLDIVSTATDRVNLFCAHFDFGKKYFSSLAAIAAIAYGTAAYYAPTDRTQKVLGACAGLSLAILPYTLIVIIPTVKAIFALKGSGDVAKINAEGDKLISKWGKLSLSRLGLAIIPWLIALREIAE